MKIYLDNCALGRLTDDQSQPRIRKEALAVVAILDLVEASVHEWVGSFILQLEIQGNTNTERRRDTSDLLFGVTFFQPLTPSVVRHANVLRRQGFKDADALHLAAALTAGCEALITVDDRFLRLAARTASLPGRFVVNPVDFQVA